MFEARVAELETLAREQGLDFFPVSFEVVPQDIMTEVAAYGLPTRARHWSYGKVYQHQHLYGAMGLSKIYEIVLNSDPGLAFLLDSNPEIANLLVAVHVFGHVDFFKNNLCFADTNRRMVNDAVGMRCALTRTSSATASRSSNTLWTLALRSTAIRIRIKACCASPIRPAVWSKRSTWSCRMTI